METNVNVISTSEHSIVFYLPSFRGGGAERVFIILANELSKRFRTTILVSLNDGPLAKSVNSDVKVVNLGHRSVSRGIPSIIKFLYIEKPDVLLSTMMYCNIICAVSMLFYFGRTKHIAREALSTTLEFSHSKLVSYSAPIIYKTIKNIIFPNNCLNNSLKKLIKLRKSTNEVIIGNPVEIEYIKSKSIEPHEIPIPKFLPKPYIIACGRMTYQKDFTMLLNAFSRVRKSRQCSLIILGDGPLRANIEILVSRNSLKDSVWLPGFVKNPFNYFASAEVFALSSIFEGQPNSMLQAMALSKKIVATDCNCGPADLAKDSNNIILSKVGDPKAFANGLLTQLDQPNLTDIYPRIAEYDHKYICRKYEQYILSII